MRFMILTGRLTQDIEFKEFEKEKKEDNVQRLTFSIANNDSGKDNPEFYDVVCWSRLAVWGSQYLKKGNRVLIAGTPRNEVYEKEDGSKRRHFKLVADRIELIG
ncbi:MAG: single-stranded DNA-binding protein [Clostridia bacterium]|nr:single-stranded DNA-binding protein [Clostridia bacterium]